MFGEMSRNREVKFEIFHLSNNVKSKDKSIHELIDDNLHRQSEVLKMKCSQCDYGQDHDAITMKSISTLYLFNLKCVLDHSPPGSLMLSL